MNTILKLKKILTKWFHDPNVLLKIDLILRVEVLQRSKGFFD